MKKQHFLLLLCFAFQTINAQVGINTTTPNALFEIKSSNEITPTNTDGLLIPKVNVFPATNPTLAQQGMLVYLKNSFGINQPGFYYWNFGTLSWISIISSSASGTLDQAYDFGGAGLGKTITADSGAVLINGTDGLVSTGTPGIGAVVPSGGGTRMVWNPRKAALRAGTITGTQWDDANIGFNSVAFGSGVLASGSFSMAVGASATASGVQSFAFGTGAVASGSQSTSFGGGTVASGFQSTAFGFFTSAIGTRSTSLGDSGTASSYGETVLGIGATTYTPSTNGATQFRTTNATDRLFVIGNAIDLDNDSLLDNVERSDAMVVLKNGNIGIGSSTPLDKLHIVGNLRMVDGNEAAGMILTSDANGTASWTNVSAANGWGLIGNAGTNSLTNFIGTTDNQSFVLKTNNLQRAIFTNSGKTIFGNGIPLTDNWFNFSKVLVGTNDSDNDLTLRSSGTDIPAINILRSNGTMSSPTVLSSGEAGSIRFWRYSGVGGFDGYNAAGRIISNVTASGTSLNLSGGIATAMVIEDSGSIGIGVTNPTERLEVAGKSLLTNGFSADNAALVYRNTTDYMFLGPQSGSSANGGAMALFGSTNVSSGNAGGVDFNVPSGQLRISHNNGNYIFRASSTSGYNATFELNDVGLQIGHNSASRAIVFNTASTERMRLTAAGRIGIGTPTPSGQLELSLDQGIKPGTFTWTLSSDKRLKTINGNYTKGLNEILQLNPILFNYKNNGERKFEQKVLDTEFPGFIAQEVQPLFPDAVGTDADGFLNFNIHPILIASINAFKELNQKNEQLQIENEALKTQIEFQNNKITTILQRLENLENKQ